MIARQDRTAGGAGRRPVALRRLAWGVALIEALVALAVVGFGMLAVVGSIGTLRHNGDVARQRSEAVRIAQDYLEEWRGYSALTATADRVDFDDIVRIPAAGAEPPVVTGSSTSFKLWRHVSQDAAVAGTQTPRRKHVVVIVQWTDRIGQVQEVRLSTTIMGIEPAMRAAGFAPPAGAPSRWIQGRPGGGVPPGARQISEGRSVLVPPGQPTGDRVVLVFNNLTGAARRCVTPAQDTASVDEDDINDANCTTIAYRILSGYIRYFSGAVSDTDASAQALSSAAAALPNQPAVQVERTQPVAGTDTCFVASENNVVEYLCAVRTSDDGTDRGGWTGRLQISGLWGEILSDANRTDPSATKLRICRFFDGPLVSSGVFTALGNETDRNLVIIQAGNGTSRYNCAFSATRRPRVWAHQPS